MACAGPTIFYCQSRTADGHSPIYQNSYSEDSEQSADVEHSTASSTRGYVNTMLDKNDMTCARIGRIIADQNRVIMAPALKGGLDARVSFLTSVLVNYAMGPTLQRKSRVSGESWQFHHSPQSQSHVIFGDQFGGE